MANRFCSGCGAKLRDGADFCVECGQRRLDASRIPRLPVSRINERYASLIVVLTVVGVSAGAILWGSLNPAPQARIPGREVPSGGAQTAALPSDHPPIAIPEEVKTTIVEMARRAEAAPDDLEGWKQLAEVQYRAGQLEPPYLADAAQSYRHILEKDPDNLEAIRGLGNVAYDQSQPELAINYYEQYLAKKPDDQEVRTDMGTMILSSGNPQKAIEIYAQVLQVKPDFFQAQFNSAIAYRQQGNREKSLEAFEKARAIAPDDRTRHQVDQLLTRMKAEPGGPTTAGGTSAGPGAPAADPHAGLDLPSLAQASPGGPLPGDFHAAAETLFRQNSVMGPRVQRIEWSSETTARVFVRDFPVDQMGESMKTMFVDRMKGRIKEQKEKFQVAAAANFEIIDEPTGRLMVTIME